MPPKTVAARSSGNDRGSNDQRSGWYERTTSNPSAGAPPDPFEFDNAKEYANAVAAYSQNGTVGARQRSIDEWAQATGGEGETIERVVPGRKDPSQNYIEQIIGNAEQNRDETATYIDETYGDIAAQLSAMGGKASGIDLQGVEEAQAALDGAQTLRGPGYRGDTKSSLAELMDPQVTAKERYLMEVSRANEERDRKATLDAAFRDMQARGVRSGGAEIAALTGAARTTSQNRMLQDLGTQAGAVDRSMRAREGVDVMGRFNALQKQNYDTWAADYASKERDAKVDRGVKRGELTSEYADRWYDRGTDPLRAKDKGATLRVANNQTGTGAVNDALKLGIGQQEAEKARMAIEESEDDGLFGWL